MKISLLGCPERPPVVGPAGEMEPHQAGGERGGREEGLPEGYGQHGQAQQDCLPPDAQI